MLAFPKATSIKNDFGSAMSMATGLSSQSTTTSGAANSKGSWVTLEASTDHDVYGFYIGVWDVHDPGVISRAVFDVGVGSAGSEVIIVPDFLVSTSVLTSDAGGGGFNYFPLFIRSGQRVAVRVQSISASNSCNAAAMFNYGSSSILPVFQGCDALGITTSSATQGVTITPGAAAYGSYVTVATTTKQYKALMPCVGIANATMASSFISVAIGISSADIFRRGYITRNTESVGSCNNYLPFYANIPSGTALQARAWASSTAALSVGIHGFY